MTPVKQGVSRIYGREGTIRRWDNPNQGCLKYLTNVNNSRLAATTAVTRLTKIVLDSRGRNELLYSESSDFILVCDFKCQLVPHWCVRQYNHGKKWSPVEPEATKCHRRLSPIEPCCHGHVLPLWHDLSLFLPACLSASHSLSVYVCFAMYRLMYICPCVYVRLYLCICIAKSLSFCLPVCLSVYVSLCLRVFRYIDVHLSMCICIRQDNTLLSCKRKFSLKHSINVTCKINKIQIKRMII